MAKATAYGILRRHSGNVPLESAMTWWDAFADVFTPLECLELHQRDNEGLTHLQDRRRIQEDFQRAVANLTVGIPKAP